MWLSGFWIAVSLAFRGLVWYLAGLDGALAYGTANLLEQNLSLDNIFVFNMIFISVAVPREYRYHVLFYGVIGAIVFRANFVLAGTALLSAFSWLVFVFGTFLFKGFRMFRRGNNDGKQTDYQNNRVLSLFRRFVTLTKDYHGDHLFA
jgi:tellurite resistance protein TerC